MLFSSYLRQCEILQEQFPKKRIVLWPQPVTSAFNSPLDENKKVKIDKTLSPIPEPRFNLRWTRER